MDLASPNTQRLLCFPQLPLIGASSAAVYTSFCQPGQASPLTAWEVAWKTALHLAAPAGGNCSRPPNFLNHGFQQNTLKAEIGMCSLIPHLPLGAVQCRYVPVPNTNRSPQCGAPGQFYTRGVQHQPANTFGAACSIPSLINSERSTFLSLYRELQLSWT